MSADNFTISLIMKWNADAETPPEHLEALAESGAERAVNMIIDGYREGELTDNIHMLDSDPEDGVPYRGWWSLKKDYPDVATPSEADTTPLPDISPIDQLVPLTGVCEPFHAEVRKLKRPYIEISEEDYQKLLEGGCDADYYRTPEGDVVTYGNSDNGYALMPLADEYAQAVLDAQPESSLRFKILRNGETSEADDINEALAITLKGFITLEMNTRETLQSEGEVTISEHISESGDRLNATITDTLFEEANKARDAGRRLYGCDGEIEFDDGQPVIKVIDGWHVECWVWVDAESARVDQFDDEDEAQVEVSYIAAAQHRDVSFDDTAKASLGDDPGAYVSGWVHVSDYDAALGAEEPEDDGTE